MLRRGRQAAAASQALNIFSGLSSPTAWGRNSRSLPAGHSHWGPSFSNRLVSPISLTPSLACLLPWSYLCLGIPSQRLKVEAFWVTYLLKGLRVGFFSPAPCLPPLVLLHYHSLAKWLLLAEEWSVRHTQQASRWKASAS